MLKEEGVGKSHARCEIFKQSTGDLECMGKLEDRLRRSADDTMYEMTIWFDAVASGAWTARVFASEPWYAS